MGICRLAPTFAPFFLAGSLPPGKEAGAKRGKVWGESQTTHLLHTRSGSDAGKRGPMLGGSRQMPMLIYQRDGPCSFKLGLHQLSAHGIERHRSHENAYRLAGIVHYWDRNSHHQLVRGNGGLIYL